MQSQRHSYKKVSLGFRFIEQDIPTEWNVASLKEASTDGLQNGIFKTKEHFGRGVPLVNVADLFKSYGISADKLERVQVNDKELKQFGVQQNDIFFCRSSLVSDGIGQVNIITNLTESAVFECHLMKLTADKTKTDPKFLFYYLRSQMARKYISSIAMTLTMTTIRQPDLEKLSVPLPSIEEQQKIASILSKVDGLIQKTDRVIEQTQRLRKSLWKKYFAVEYFNKLGDVADCTIDDIKSSGKNAIAMGPFGSNIKTDNFVPKGVPVIRGINLTKEPFYDDEFVYLTEEKADDLKTSNAFREDIVLTHRGTIGQVGIIPKDSKYPRYIVSQSQIKVSIDTKKAIPFFVYYFLKSPYGQRQWLMNRTGTGVPSVASPTSTLKAIVLSLPEIKVQERISTILLNVDRLLSKEEDSRRNFVFLKCGLMQKLLTGQIRVKA